jgi:hypothetical protein
MDEDHINKKENTKENVRETKRVFVENLPKPKGWLRENAPIIIAALAFLVSIYSVFLSTRDFIATHRPYVYVISRKMAQNDKTVMDVKTVLYACLNAPAKITNHVICYEIVKTNENGIEDINEIPLESLGQIILYPTAAPETQQTILYDFEKEVLYPNVKLRRKIKIEYKELSSDRTYHFEGVWDYNKMYNVWEVNDMFGD